MHTDSSASFTYLVSRSASECTATVRMPISRQARWIRSAISPRLAIRIFLNTAGWLLDRDERLAVFDRLAILRKDGFYGAFLVRLDFVHQFHCLDDADHLAHFHGVAHFDERLGARAGRPIEH